MSGNRKEGPSMDQEVYRSNLDQADQSQPNELVRDLIQCVPSYTYPATGEDYVLTSEAGAMLVNSRNQTAAIAKFRKYMTEDQINEQIVSSEFGDESLHGRAKLLPKITAAVVLQAIYDSVADNSKVPALREDLLEAEEIEPGATKFRYKRERFVFSERLQSIFSQLEVSVAPDSGLRYISVDDIVADWYKLDQETLQASTTPISEYQLSLCFRQDLTKQIWGF